MVIRSRIDICILLGGKHTTPYSDDSLRVMYKLPHVDHLYHHYHLVGPIPDSLQWLWHSLAAFPCSPAIYA